MPQEMHRRELLKKGLAVSAGMAAFLSREDKILMAASQTAPPPAPKSAVVGDSDMPMGKIGPLKISRLIVGGNLISGYAHSRDLVYVSSLLKSYFTEDKIFETFQICEECGINTAILRLDANVIRLINKYWNERGGKMQWIAQVKVDDKDMKTPFQQAADNGASAAFVHGNVGDSFVADGRTDLLAECLTNIREHSMPAGIAGHDTEVVKACEKAALKPDFYMKTLHKLDYGSATAPDMNDNIFCRQPEETIAAMKTAEAPWIGYKVLAAGAIRPGSGRGANAKAADGFRYAFENGADFINVGMFDFQVREDAVIVKQLLADMANMKRERPWRG